MFPKPGFRLNPTDLELIYCLKRKIQEGGFSSSIIPDMDMYGLEPWLLPHVGHPCLEKHLWYYFVTRTKKSATATQPNRVVIGREGGGRWKSQTSEYRIYDHGNNLVGYCHNLTFMKKEKGSKVETKTGWVMKEYCLTSEGFQDLVLCRIRFMPGQKDPGPVETGRVAGVVGLNHHVYTVHSSLEPFDTQVPPSESLGIAFENNVLSTRIQGHENAHGDNVGQNVDDIELQQFMNVPECPHFELLGQDTVMPPYGSADIGAADDDMNWIEDLDLAQLQEFCFAL